jgi:hypothetical protein
VRERRELIDEVAIREFLHTFYPRLVGGLSLVAGSRAASEDAVQEAVARPGNDPSVGRRSSRCRRGLRRYR